MKTLILLILLLVGVSESFGQTDSLLVDNSPEAIAKLKTIDSFLVLKPKKNLVWEKMQKYLKKNQKKTDGHLEYKFLKRKSKRKWINGTHFDVDKAILVYIKSNKRLYKEYNASKIELSDSAKNVDWEEQLVNRTLYKFDILKFSIFTLGQFTRVKWGQIDLHLIPNNYFTISIAPMGAVHTLYTGKKIVFLSLKDIQKAHNKLTTIIKQSGLNQFNISFSRQVLTALDHEEYHFHDPDIDGLDREWRADSCSLRYSGQAFVLERLASALPLYDTVLKMNLYAKNLSGELYDTLASKYYQYYLQCTSCTDSLTLSRVTKDELKERGSLVVYYHILKRCPQVLTCMLRKIRRLDWVTKSPAYLPVGAFFTHNNLLTPRSLYL